MNEDILTQKKPEPPVREDAQPVPEEIREQVAEALLFSAGDSVALVFIAKTLGISETQTQEIIEHLAAKYDQENRGIRIIRVGKEYQMTSRPDFYPYIGQMYASKAAQIRLTDTQLETLSIIAYRQPVTKVEVDDIRGVHSDAIVNRLLEYGLIEEQGRLKAPGRPIQFGTSKYFLEYFGLQDLSEMPHLAELQQTQAEETPVPTDLGDLEIVEKNEE